MEFSVKRFNAPRIGQLAALLFEVNAKLLFKSGFVGLIVRFVTREKRKPDVRLLHKVNAIILHDSREITNNLACILHDLVKRRHPALDASILFGVVIAEYTALASLFIVDANGMLFDIELVLIVGNLHEPVDLGFELLFGDTNVNRTGFIAYSEIGSRVVCHALRYSKRIGIVSMDNSGVAHIDRIVRGILTKQIISLFFRQTFFHRVLTNSARSSSVVLGASLLDTELLPFLVSKEFEDSFHGEEVGAFSRVGIRIVVELSAANAAFFCRIATMLADKLINLFRDSVGITGKNGYRILETIQARLLHVPAHKRIIQFSFELRYRHVFIVFANETLELVVVQRIIFRLGYSANFIVRALLGS